MFTVKAQRGAGRGVEIEVPGRHAQWEQIKKNEALQSFDPTLSLVRYPPYLAQMSTMALQPALLKVSKFEANLGLNFKNA